MDVPGLDRDPVFSLSSIDRWAAGSGGEDTSSATGAVVVGVVAAGAVVIGVAGAAGAAGGTAGAVGALTGTGGVGMRGVAGAFAGGAVGGGGATGAGLTVSEIVTDVPVEPLASSGCAIGGTLPGTDNATWKAPPPSTLARTIAPANPTDTDSPGANPAPLTMGVAPATTGLGAAESVGPGAGTGAGGQHQRDERRQHRDAAQSAVVIVARVMDGAGVDGRRGTPCGCGAWCSHDLPGP